MQWHDSIIYDWATSDLNIYLNKTYYNQLNKDAKNQIIFSGFSIGAVEYLNNDMSTLISNENSIIRSSNIALPTVSEYIRTNRNKNNCGTMRLFNNNYRSCGSTGWMDNNNDWWAITPVYDSPSDIYSISSNDAIDRRNAIYNCSVFPVLYLSSDTQITGGTGTKSDPYTIE